MHWRAGLQRIAPEGDNQTKGSSKLHVFTPKMIKTKAALVFPDHSTGRVVVSVPTDVQISFLPRRVVGLSDATAQDLEQVELSPSGLSLHFPAIDADVYIPALMQNVLGSKSWMARIGQAGGAVRSERKSQAARENGRLGGRPKAA